jgi:pyruvate dehydrogenase E2 component (dihydrolipoamide acetyltransferase)
MSNDIIAITMPKWGLSMTEGKVIEWLVEEGVDLNAGDEIVDIETEKIANTFEALEPGLLRRKVAATDETLPIGALLGVMASADIADKAVDAFIEEFQANYVPPEPDEEETGASYEFVEVGGYRLRYLKMGDGEKTVILVHGFGGDLDRWLFTQQPLAASASVYALDLPGHGLSTKKVIDGSVAALTEVVAGFMDAVQIESAHIVGHSLGGGIALQLAIAHPKRVESLALIAPVGLGDEINGEFIQGFITSESRREIKPLLQKLVGDPNLINRNLINDILKFKRLDGVTEALQTIADGFVKDGKQTVRLRDSLASISAPVKVIWGSVDQIIPAHQAAGLPERVETVVLEGFGHLVQLEAASEVNALLTS